MNNQIKNNIDIQSDGYVVYNSLIKNQKNLELRDLIITNSLIKTINDNINITDNSVILEVGFNDGSRLKKIASFYEKAKVIGLEVRQSCVDKLVKEGYDCRLVTDEIFNINEKFDVIYGYAIIHHISIPYDYLRLLFSLLKPGGILIFPQEAYKTHLIASILSTISGIWKYEINMFKLSKRKIVNDCKKYTTNFKIGYNGLIFLYGFPKLNKIYRALSLHKLPFINDLSIFIKKENLNNS
jgi:SAM-dependent methyltransferase